MENKKYNLEITELQKCAILSGLDLLERMLCDDNPSHKANELGISNIRAICNELREKLK